MSRSANPFNHHQTVLLGRIIVPPAVIKGRSTDQAYGGNQLGNSQHENHTMVLDACIQHLRQGKPPPLLLLHGGPKHTRDSLRVALGHVWVEAMLAVGWQQAQAVVLSEDHSASLNALERWQHGACSPWRLAEALSDLHKRCRWTQQQLGLVIHKSREYVADALVIKRIQPGVRELIRSHQRTFPLTLRHLRTIARERPAKQRSLVEYILRERLSSKQLEQYSKTGYAKTSALVKAVTNKRGRPKNRTIKEWLALRKTLQQEILRLEKRQQRQLTSLQKNVQALKLKQRQVRLQHRAKQRLLERELKRIQSTLRRANTLAHASGEVMQPNLQSPLEEKSSLASDLDANANTNANQS